jgi:peptidoglycan/LPS O-acetylase OafA/YrhL
VPRNSTEPAEALQDHPTVSETRGRVPELDGFRAIAIWMVLGAHLVDGWTLPSGALNGVPAPVLFGLSRGWLGVDLFFVLSGLLITGILLDAKEKPSYYRNFYARRFLRIIPLYFTVITITFLAYRSPALYFLLSYLFLANVAGALRVPIPHGPGVFWSLAVEEHFYLAWPMVIRFLSRNSLILTCLLIFLASPVLRGIAAARGLDPAQEIYPLSWYRFDGLALGALLAIWLRSKSCSPKKSLRLAGAMAVLSFLIMTAGAPFGVLGTKTVASVALRYTHMQLIFGAGILSSLAMPGSLLTGWLRTSFMRISAELSYCVYLIHLSVGDGYQWMLRNFSFEPVALLGPRGAFLAQSLFIVGASFGLAAVSRKFLEEPCLRLKRYFS